MHSRSACITAVIFSCSIVFLAHAEPSVLIDSLSGKAEIQRAGHITWEPCRQGDALSNNDMLRVLANSSARLKWEDNNTVYVRANSQININIFQDQQKELISRHITVFYGALYFVLKKTLPKALTEWADLKVYTPTTVIGIRGTSFTVEVDKKTGTTDVAVLSGTVLVRNIIRNAALFVASSNKTKVEMNADPSGPLPLEEADVAYLKTWAPRRPSTPPWPKPARVAGLRKRRPLRRPPRESRCYGSGTHRRMPASGKSERSFRRIWQAG